VLLDRSKPTARCCQNGGELRRVARQLAPDRGGFAGGRFWGKRHHQQAQAITKRRGFQDFIGEQCMKVHHQTTVTTQLMVLPVLNACARATPEVGNTVIQKVEPAVGQPSN
jgi:hypothetical protein